MANGISDSQPSLREAEDAHRQRAENAAKAADVLAGFQRLLPAIQGAEVQYKEQNSIAFAGIEPSIVGMVEILPLTPKMFLDLEGAGNAFFAPKGTEITVGDLAAFLWRCSPYYSFGRPDSIATRRFFNANLFVVPFHRAVDEIEEYIVRAWSGMPLWRKSPTSAANLAQWPSRLVHMFAKEYGWSEEYILNLPFRRLWQYANRILESHDPDYRELCNAAMRIRQKWLEAVNNVTKGGPN